MGTLALIGLLGGLITGISPCILPVLPVIFFSGTTAPDAAPGPAGTGARTPGRVAVDERPPRTASRLTLRPFLVIAGLVVSFATFTLIGSALLSLLGLPQDALRWIGLVALVLIGVGLIVPRFERILERPFALIPQRRVGGDRSGFLLGLAIGVVYVPCAGPVLAAIVVAGATGDIGWRTVVLTVCFAVGAAVPLLIFALAGQQISQRISAFRERQRAVRIVSGVAMILLAVALVFNIPQVLQRAIPDYTTGLQDEVADPGDIQNRLDTAGTGQDAEITNCTDGAEQLQSCGTAPDIAGISSWFNTPGDRGIDLKSLRGKVVLIDFWAYSCINCQRSIPHTVTWNDKYKNLGLQVIGVHSPEYAFEKVRGNVMSGAKGLGITYPVALDNKLATWTNFANQYWPAEYLIDSDGTVRHVKFGEGDYNVTESLIRKLLQKANPAVTLPKSSNDLDTTPQQGVTRETYLGATRAANYEGVPELRSGERDYTVPDRQDADTFALRGRWDADDEGITATTSQSSIVLNYHARKVYLVVGGQGTVTVTENGRSREIPIGGAPTLYPVHDGQSSDPATLDLRFSPGLKGYSFTFG
ncbi:cytochrome c biogenesis protein CcdA [Williamsia maris]|uniref:Cytochrome c biogenesis protein CcdA n=1 Tax=Williamsia maris TaxID=72806 RepID=A0ABT1HDE0_9NOCA|nr:cytochrome c biogenesis protein CcdA [Williamsia maris]MCP2176275.1 Cytochrome c biogenesis protein CcdA [Williamsia maris]